MNSRRIAALLVAAGFVVAGVYALDPGLFGSGEYDRATVPVRDEDGSTLATVDVRIADTQPKRFTGLSDTASLADGEGMLFVHDRAGTHSYVMREMAFPLDIVFASPNGTVTTIHHAELPPEDADSLRPYPGEGKYVLELPYGYTNQTGIDVGDRLVIPDGY